MQITSSAELRTMANELKADAKALQHTNRKEAMRLFRLFQQIVRELRRRRRTVHQLN